MSNNNKRLRSRYYTVEANHWRTQSIARPLCDIRATCPAMLLSCKKLKKSLRSYEVTKLQTSENRRDRVNNHNNSAVALRNIALPTLCHHHIRLLVETVRTQLLFHNRIEIHIVENIQSNGWCSRHNWLWARSSWCTHRTHQAPSAVSKKRAEFARPAVKSTLF